MENNQQTDSEALGIRVNKYIASSGFCSRRQADEYISKGKVTVDGLVCETGTRIFDGQQVCVNGTPVIPADAHIYLAFNKPLGITCTTDQTDPDNIIDFIGYPQRIFPIGRLDKNSSGLILLTNDGDIVNSLLRAENGHEKEYNVTLNRPIAKPDEFFTKMANGVYLEELDRTTLPCKITQTGNRSFTIVLKQGLNRQIRRMCDSLDYKVVKLRRVRFMNIELGKLPIGKYRDLTKSEKTQLFKLIGHS